MKTPINNGILQSDLDCDGFDLLNFSGGGGAAENGLPVGGTTGQLLRKLSSTDFDAAWATVAGSGSAVQGYIVSVKNAPYNAIGDGTTDDSVAIQAAINDVISAGGGTVFFPHGVYLCNAVPYSFWNSILTFPAIDGNTNAVAIELLGENQPVWSAMTGLFELHNSVIKTTRTDGSGTFPAIIAGGQPLGETVTAYSAMSALAVSIKNLVFLLGDDPSYGAIRLDKVGMAFIENVNVYGGPSSPTHNVVGIWTPNTINWSYNYVNRCVVQGIKTGYCFGEHLRAVDIYANECYNGVKFLPNNYPCWGNIKLSNCVEGLVFVGTQCVVDLLVETEHSPGGWTVSAHDVSDPTNAGTGIIRYYIGNGMGGGDTTIALNGGAGLTIIGLFNGDITLPTTGGAGGSHGGGVFKGKMFATNFLLGYTDTGLARSNNSEITVTNGSTGLGNLVASTIYLSTDARFTPISGGVKLETRNTGTGVWVESARWTNP